MIRYYTDLLTDREICKSTGIVIHPDLTFPFWFWHIKVCALITKIIPMGDSAQIVVNIYHDGFGRFFGPLARKVFLVDTSAHLFALVHHWTRSHPKVLKFWLRCLEPGAEYDYTEMVQS